MTDAKIKLEIYEDDPFEGSCCATVRSSKGSVDQLRRMLIERNEILRKLDQEFRGTIEVSRDIVSTRRGLVTYPEHLQRALSEKGLGSLPHIFLEGKLVSTGKFPTYEEFLALLNAHLRPSGLR